MSVTHCSSHDCCSHDITRGITRDGVTHSICLECGLEADADDMPVVDTATAVPVLGTMLPEVGTIPEVVSPAIPCGDDTGICQLTPKADDDIPHRWGWL